MNKLKQLFCFMLERLKERGSPELSWEEKVRLREPKYRQKILHGQEGNDLVGKLIAGNRPMMVSRLGSNELSCLSFYLQNRVGKSRRYPNGLTDRLRFNAGFFPVKDGLLDRFAELYLGCIRDVDIMAVWFNADEDFVCNTCCPNAGLVELGCLEPFLFKNPWSARLQGKKVLVVHPFDGSIRKQYEKRRLLFADPAVLPDFELKTVKAVQSMAGARVDFPTWFDAYDHMCRQIADSDFDIAIVGAGAYGLPLASFVKKMGKQAIHLGGVTQILFGIKGKRWETSYAETTGKLFNEHWVRPGETEMPAGHKKVEDGCYW
jgi:hypothetical protein